MKKLLASLATVVLVGGSVAGVTAFTQMHQKTASKVQPQPKQQLGAGVVNPYAIANKLRKHTIKLDPNVWLGRNTKDFENQINAIVVKDGILTQDEAQYVTWSSVNLTVAGWYWTVDFTVTVPGATATDNVTLDMDSGETTAQIGAKLKQHPVRLNYNWWSGKNLLDYLPEFKNIIVNEGILTRIEASEIIGLFDISGDPSNYTVDATGGFYINYNINDRNTDTSAYTYGVSVYNDGLSAQQLASKIVSTDNYHISKNDVDDYAYSKGPEGDIKKQLLTYTFASDEINYVQMPRVILKQVNNVQFNVKKDGQNALSVPCIITCDQ